jgi:transposase
LLIFDIIDCIIYSMKYLSHLNKPLLPGFGAKSGLPQPDTLSLTDYLNQFIRGSIFDFRAFLSLLPQDTDYQGTINKLIEDELASYREQIIELNNALSTESSEKSNYMARCKELEDKLAKAKAEIIEQGRALLVFRSEATERWKLLGGSWLPGSSIHPQNPTSIGAMAGGELNSILLGRLNALEAEKTFLEAENAKLRTMIKSLNDENLALREKIDTPQPDSSNSGISPSKDPPWASPIKGKKIAKLGEQEPKKPRGGQIGHKGHFRPLFNNDEIDETHDYASDECQCPHCGSKLVREPSEDKSYDQFQKPPEVINKVRHNSLAYKCEKCGKLHYGHTPKAVTDGWLLDIPLLVELFLYRALGNVTIRKSAELFKQNYGVTLSHSCINNYLRDMGFILRPIYLEILDSIKNEPVLNVDETTHKFCGKRTYTWTFKGELIVAYKIGTRASHNLISVLGDNYEGTLGSDCYAPYLSYVKNHPKAKLQLCLVHLKRDFVHCSQFNNVDMIAYGEKGAKLVENLIHWYNERQKIEDINSVDALLYHSRLLKIKGELIEHAANPKVLLGKAKGIAKRFQTHPEYYFTFIDTPGIGPSNNPAEQIIRSVVVERKISYGTQSITGNWRCETFWSITNTLRMNNIDMNEFLIRSLTAHHNGEPLPSLVNIGGTVDPKYVERNKKDIKTQLEKEKQDRKDKKGIKGNKIEVKSLIGNAESVSTKGESKGASPNDWPSSEFKSGEKPKQTPPEFKSNEEPKEPSSKAKSNKVKRNPPLAKRRKKKVARKELAAVKKKQKEQSELNVSQEDDKCCSKSIVTNEKRLTSLEKPQRIIKPFPLKKLKETSITAARVSNPTMADRTLKRLRSAPGS